MVVRRVVGTYSPVVTQLVTHRPGPVPTPGSHPHDLATPERATARVQPSTQPLADLVELGIRGVMY